MRMSLLHESVLPLDAITGFQKNKQFMDILFLINPRAGELLGSVWLSALEERLTYGCHGLKTTVMSTREGAIQDQLRELAPGKDRIFVVGGDGTVSEAMNAISQLGLSLPMGIVPIGTGNDLARSLGLYRGRPWPLDDVVAYAMTPRTTTVDLWSLNGCLTFNNYMSVGLDAWVVRGFSRIRSWIIGHLKWCKRPIYFAIYLLSWIGNASRRVHPMTRLSWTDPVGRGWSHNIQRARVVAITNTPYYAAGALIDPDANVGDGIFEITIFSNMLQYAQLLAMRVPLLARLGVQHGGFRIRARDLRIHLPEPTCIQVDGEDATDAFRGDRTLSIQPQGQIQVLV